MKVLALAGCRKTAFLKGSAGSCLRRGPSSSSFLLGRAVPSRHPALSGKRFFGTLLALCLAAGTAVAASSSTLLFPDGKSVTVEVVDTPKARERGLMFRRTLPKDYGMLFVFPREVWMQFWMKNTFVSLDIVFIGADKRVTVAHSRVRPSKKDTRDEDVARAGGLAQYVLELPGGYAGKRGLKPGAPLIFEATIPTR
jgi:uncharacterized membrane protein (UPF0127 family)